MRHIAAALPNIRTMPQSRRLIPLALLCLGFLPGRTGAQNLYTLTALAPLTGGKQSVASALNNSGQAVGYSFGDPANGGAERAVIWNNGVATNLGLLQNATDAWATDINDSGEVVGGSNGSQATSFAWTAAGGIRDLGATPQGYPTTALSVNAGGQVLGYARMQGYYTSLYPAVYDGTSWSRSPTLYYYYWSGSAAQINASGQIAGSVQYYTGGGNSTNSAVVFQPSGDSTDLRTVLGHSAGYAINDSGEMVGYYYPASYEHAFLWSALSGVTDLGTLGTG